MYLPKHFEETRVEVLHELIHAHPLGALVTLMPAGSMRITSRSRSIRPRRRSGPCAATSPAPIRSGVTPRETWRLW
jgi:predicted FMN-binding regulatory protein PaiB